MQLLSQIAMQGRAKFHVMLTSYETVLVEAGMLRQLKWGSLVVDEGHRLKNKNSRLFLVSTYCFSAPGALDFIWKSSMKAM